MINRYINYIIVLFAFCVPISRAGIVFCVSLLIILWTIDNYKNIQNELKLLISNKVIIVLFTFIAFSYLSILWSEHIKEAFRYVNKYWYYLAIIVIYKSIKKEYIEYALSAFLFGMMISEIISYGIFFELWTFKHGSPTDPTPFMNHLQYSMFLAFTALLLLNRFFNESKLLYKYGYFLYFITVTINLFINGGRTGQVAFILSIFVVGFLNVKNKLKSLIIITTLLTLILTTAYQYSPTFKYKIRTLTLNIHKLINNHNFNTSIGARIGFWIVGYEIIKDNPILGVGMEDTMSTTQIYANKLPYDFTDVKQLPNYHNDFLQIVVTLGFLGAILYILIFYNIFKINITNVKYKNLPIIFVSVFIISSMFENMFHQQFSMAIFTLFVGLFLAQQEIETNQQRNTI